MEFFRNMVAISQIDDPFFRLSMWMLNLRSDFGNEMAKRLPEYFLTEQPEGCGPVPLSVIKIRAEKSAAEYEVVSVEYAFQCSVSCDAVSSAELGLIYFAISPLGLQHQGCDMMLPTKYLTICDDFKTGDTFEWNGEKLVVLENNDSCYWIIATPESHVINDLPELSPVHH